MVVVAIVAILAAIAFPSFEATMRSNRVATTTNELIASFALARSEAVRSPRGAGICTSTDGESCTGTDWNLGWIVWIDAVSDDGPQVNTGAGDRIVRYSQAKPGVEIAAEDGVDNLRFDQRGFLDGGLQTLTLQSTECPTNAPLVRTFIVRATGGTSVARGTCS